MTTTQSISYHAKIALSCSALLLIWHRMRSAAKRPEARTVIYSYQRIYFEWPVEIDTYPIEARINWAFAKHPLRSNQAPWMVSIQPIDVSDWRYPASDVSSVGYVQDTYHTMLDEKNVRPLGQLNEFACSALQTSGIAPRVQFITAICTKQAQMLAATWHAKVIRGGTFM